MERGERRPGRIYIPPDTPVELVSDEGSIIQIRYRKKGGLSLNQRIPTESERERTKLTEKFPGVVLSFTEAWFNQQRVKIVPLGDEGMTEGKEVDLTHAQANFKRWIEAAKNAGFSNREIIKEAQEILRTIHITETHMGEASPFAKAIFENVIDLVSEIYSPGKAPQRKAR